jgi:hypothetical protein
MSNHSQEDAFAGPSESKGRRYFFDVHDGDHLTPDVEGVVCADLDEAAKEAVITLPEMAKDVVPDGDYRELVVRVRDEAGKEVLRASLVLRVERLG